MTTRTRPARLALSTLTVALAACAGETSVEPVFEDPVYEGLDGVTCGEADEGEVDQERPSGWTYASHCKGADADYARLFDADAVHRIDITVSAANYAATQANLDDILGSSGQGGPGGGGADVDEEPMWVPVTVEYDGLTWWQVAMRYKGNSSLRSAYNSGVGKLSFRLDFDEYEDMYPELDDQRFYGFKKMTFSNGFNDPSLIRDKVAADIFRDGGVPAARGSFARIYVDFGEGPTYFGLYTMIEDVSNKMLDTQFDDDGGNLYKPDGDGARLASFVEGDMIKKTNEDDADFYDAEALIAAINADRGDDAAWRAGLEAVFDVDRYLAYLALNQSMVNWDAYGWMTHNYYLYNDPSDGRFTWIPWDLNEAMLDRSGGMAQNSTSVLLDEISSQWPLIRNVLDDDVYAARYRQELENAAVGAFAEDTVAARMQAAHDLIAPWVVGADGEQSPYTFLRNDAEFEDSVDGDDGLIEHVRDRHDAVAAALR